MNDHPGILTILPKQRNEIAFGNAMFRKLRGYGKMNKRDISHKKELKQTNYISLLKLTLC
jgi:hypothetical protein